MNELSSYLDQQRSAGTVEQIDNVFTLSLEKGREKLSSYSLAQPEEYLLKLVQTAVVVGATTLNVKLLRGAVLVYFELPTTQDRIGADRLSRALSAPLEAADRALAYLALALCAAANEQPRELMWGEWSSNEGGTILSLGQDRTEVFRQAPYPGTEALREGRTLYVFYLKKSLAELPIGQTAREHTAITRRCCFAPLNLFLDGRPVDPHIPAVFNPHDPLLSITEPYYALLEIESTEPPGLRFPANPSPPPSNLKLPVELTHLNRSLPPVALMRVPPGFRLPLTSPFQFSSLLALPVFLFGPASVIYVKDGVCLAPIKVFDSGGGAVAILRGDHVHTDMSGLQPVRDEQVEEEIERVVERWRAATEEVFAHPFPVLKATSHVRAQNVALSAAGCIVLGWLGLLAGPLYAYYRMRTKKEQDPGDRLLEDLLARRQRVAFDRKPAAR